jgi:ribosome-associated protein
VSQPLPITDRIVIPAVELTLEFARSSGPGGQHVNKTETRARLRFDLAGSAILSEEVKARVRTSKAGTLTVAGELILVCERFRSRERNIQAVRSRLAELIRRALRPPKKRRPTRPTRSSRERRLEHKRQRSEVKQGRGKVRG